jgi:hypothetical protein
MCRSNWLCQDLVRHCVLRKRIVIKCMLTIPDLIPCMHVSNVHRSFEGNGGTRWECPSNGLIKASCAATHCYASRKTTLKLTLTENNLIMACRYLKSRRLSTTAFCAHFPVPFHTLHSYAPIRSQCSRPLLLENLIWSLSASFYTLRCQRCRENEFLSWEG